MAVSMPYSLQTFKIIGQLGTAFWANEILIASSWRWVSEGYPVLQQLLGYIVHIPDSKVHGANMGPTWGWQDPGGPHVGHFKIVIWDDNMNLAQVWGLIVLFCGLVLVSFTCILQGYFSNSWAVIILLQCQSKESWKRWVNGLYESTK